MGVRLAVEKWPNPVSECAKSGQTRCALTPEITLWNTGRHHAHTLAYSAAHDLIVAGHGLKGGMRSKGYRGNATPETADGVSLWSTKGVRSGHAHFASLPSSLAIHPTGCLLALIGTHIYKYDLDMKPMKGGVPLTLPLCWDAEAPSPRLLPSGTGALTTLNGMLVVLDLQTQRLTRIAPAPQTHILAISGDSRRILLAHPQQERSELALYALNQEEKCLARWTSTAMGCAALSYDGSAAMLTGGETLAEWARFAE